MTSADLFAALSKCFSKYMVLEDSSILRCVTASYMANVLEGRPPIWLVILGDPGGGKTELLKLFEKCERTVSKSNITPASLLSGWDSAESLLTPEMDGKVLLLYDFSTFIEGSRDQVVKLMSLMRYVYDGALQMHTGKGPLEFTGKLGFMSACTPALDEYKDFVSKLGERFMYIRMLDEDSDKMMEAAIKGSTYRDKLREKAQLLMKELVETFELQDKSFSGDLFGTLKETCKIMVMLRASFERDRYTKEILRKPIVEKPTRVATALSRILLCARVTGAPDGELYTMLLRFLRDSMDEDRRQILEFVNSGKVKLADVALYVRRSKSVVGRRIEELEEIGVLKQDKQNYYHISSPLVKEAIEQWLA